MIAMRRLIMIVTLLSLVGTSVVAPAVAGYEPTPACAAAAISPGIALSLETSTRPGPEVLSALDRARSECGVTPAAPATLPPPHNCPANTVGHADTLIVLTIAAPGGARTFEEPGKTVGEAQHTVNINGDATTFGYQADSGGDGVIRVGPVLFPAMASAHAACAPDGAMCSAMGEATYATVFTVDASSAWATC